MKVMILAAGRGERLRPLTDSIPKALVEVRGQSLLERHLDKIRDAGISDVVINLGWKGEKIRDRLGSGSRFGLNIEFSDEGDNVLETGGGVFKALHLLGDDAFLVVNADIYSDMPIPQINLPESSLGHLVLVPSPAYRDGGDFELVDGKIQNGESPILTFSGVAQYRAEIFRRMRAGEILNCSTFTEICRCRPTERISLRRLLGRHWYPRASRRAQVTHVARNTRRVTLEVY